MKDIIEYLSDIAEKNNIKPYELPGLWEIRVDDNWTIKVNAHTFEVEKIPPCHTIVYYNDFPAGVFDITEGQFAAGGEVNYEKFIEALEALV